MGFSLKQFFANLESMIIQDLDAAYILRFVREMKEYAKECGEID